MTIAPAMLGLLLVVPPPRPVTVPSSNVASVQRDHPRRDRAIRAGLIASAVTAGVGLGIICAIVAPFDAAYQHELAQAKRAWDFDLRRAHLDRAGHDWRIARHAAFVGAPTFVIGTISTFVFALLYTRAHRAAAQRGASSISVMRISPANRPVVRK